MMKLWQGLMRPPDSPPGYNPPQFQCLRCERSFAAWEKPDQCPFCRAKKKNIKKILK